ncbi:hypothetical protein CEP51_007692 [Fusarium floridanum]|uniref:Uncharacterized protein n=1 Tax=Fusarium floridanum TaxID=1325733 RepID=A0A428RNJ8_9HYPO|nr:hypothetical protein CEP51_007692 [Fusarium floridanum]
MEPWKTSNSWAPAQSSPVDPGPSSFPPPGAVIFSFSPSNPAPAAAPTIPAPAQAAAPAAVVSPAPAPATNGSRGLHRCPYCHKMGIHRPEECRSAPQNISRAGVTVVEFGPGTTVATLRAVMSQMWPQSVPVGPPNGIKKSRRRRGHKPGRRTNDARPRPEDKGPGAGSTGGGRWNGAIY